MPPAARHLLNSREEGGWGAEKRERGGGTEEGWKKLRGERRLETIK